MKACALSRFYVVSVIVLLIGPTAAVSQTSTATGQFEATITIEADCQVTSTQTLDFGTFGVLSSDVDATSNIVVTCTPGVPYQIGLNEGSGAGATTTVRRMTAASETIDYGLFQDAGRVINWGNSPPTDTVAATGTGNGQTHTVYGRVPPQPTPAAGTYSDTITVTVTY